MTYLPERHEGVFDDAVELEDDLRAILKRVEAMGTENTELAPVHLAAIKALHNTVRDAINETLEVQRWTTDPKQTQPCGHPESAIVSSDEGTHHCADCEAEAS